MTFRGYRQLGVVILAVLAGGAGGYWLAVQKTEAVDKSKSRASMGPAASGRKGEGTGTAATDAPGRKVYDVASLMSAALGERRGDLRWARTMEAIGKMDEKNWREILGSFDQAVATMGAEFRNERIIALTRAGYLGGRTAVEELLEKDKTAGKGFGTSSQAFEGWASRDPQAAWDWMRQSDDESLSQACLLRFAWGISAADPSSHFDYFRQLSSAEKAMVATDTTRALIQTEGFPAAERLLAGELSSDAGGDNSAALRTIFDVIARQRRHAVQNGADVDDACRWLAEYAGKPFVSTDQFKGLSAQLATSRGPGAAVNWMASVYSGESANVTGPALGAAMQAWAGKDPNEAGEWLRAQRRHPGYGAMVSAFVTSIKGDDPEAAAAWQKTID